MTPRHFACGVLLAALAGCGGSPGTPSPATHSSSPSPTTKREVSSRPAVSRPVARKRTPPAYPELSSAALATSPTPFVPAVISHGQTAAWIARAGSGVTLLSFNQRLVALHLHSGTIDAGSSGWRYGPAV